MKIALVAAAKSVHTIKIANALVARGHEVAVFSQPEHVEINSSLSKEVKVFTLIYTGQIGYYRNAKELKRQLNKFNPNVINAHYASGYGTLARLTKAKPLLISVWGSDVFEFPYKNIFNRRLLLKNLNSASAILATGNALKTQVSTLKCKRPIEITPFGVDLNAFKPNAVQHDGIKIGIVKALEPVYGIDILISEFAKVKNQHKDTNISLDIYGDGSRIYEYQQQINAINMSEHIKLMGRVEHSKVPEILNGFDIFVAPSRAESFGVAVLEAAACGVCCVTSKAKGFMEICKDEQTALMFDISKPSELSAQIERLIFDQDLRKTLAENALKNVSENYDWQENADKFEEILKKYSN